jgi:hypothetical protein
MDANDATAMAARTLIKGATLEELREAVRDLRALSPDSALADLVEARMDQLMAGSEQTEIGAKGAASAHPSATCSLKSHGSCSGTEKRNRSRLCGA